MMFTKKRLLSLFLVLVMVDSMIPLGLLSGTAEAAKNSELLYLDDLTKKFPNGKYWNHFGSANNPDAWTDYACSHHGPGKCSYYGYCGCNSFMSAIQCYGFAKKLTYDYFGTPFDKWGTSTNMDSIKAGDVFRYSTGPDRYHYIWVTKVSNNRVYFADCNRTDICQIWWKGEMTLQELKNKSGKLYVSPSSSTKDRPTKFYDVLGGQWYTDSVKYITNVRKLMNGVDSYRFDLESNFTYAQIATVLWNLSNNPDPKGNYGSEWYAKAMTWGKEKGIFDNCPSHSPNDDITRENFALVLYNFDKKMGVDMNYSRYSLDGFRDKGKVSSKNIIAMKWAVTKGIIGGSKVGNYYYLNPKSYATRAEVATMLARFLKNCSL